jgi:hypothetical protein
MNLSFFFFLSNKREEKLKRVGDWLIIASLYHPSEQTVIHPAYAGFIAFPAAAAVLYISAHVSIKPALTCLIENTSAHFFCSTKEII